MPQPRLRSMPSGDVYVGGTFKFALNFDPTASRAFTLTSGGDTDGFTLKLDQRQLPLGPAGRRLPLADTVADLAVDAQGSVYTTGLFNDTVDFDPRTTALICCRPERTRIPMPM